MVGAKLRSFLIRIIKNKPTPTGFRVWCLCESGNVARGYYHHMIVNDGKEKEAPGMDFTKALGARVILLLAEHMRKGDTIFVDRFFSSIPLACHLLQHRGIYMVGTIRKGAKGFPSEEFKDIKKNAANPRGTYKVLQTQGGKVQVMVWRDSGVVTAIATGRKAYGGKVMVL